MYKEYIRRFALCILGLVLYGLGNSIGVKAGVAGTNAWSTLSLGLAGITNISFGTATFLISLVIISIDLLGKGKLGFGTILNLLLIPVFSDLFLALFSFIPDATNPVLGAIVSLLGQVVEVNGAVIAAGLHGGVGVDHSGNGHIQNIAGQIMQGQICCSQSRMYNAVLHGKHIAEL